MSDKRLRKDCRHFVEYDGDQGAIYQRCKHPKLSVISSVLGVIPATRPASEIRDDVNQMRSRGAMVRAKNVKLYVGAKRREAKRSRRPHYGRRRLRREHRRHPGFSNQGGRSPKLARRGCRSGNTFSLSTLRAPPEPLPELGQHGC